MHFRLFKLNFVQSRPAFVVRLYSLGFYFLSALVSSSVYGQTQNSYPMLMSLKPVAVQVGQTTECEVSARYNLFGATKVFVSGEGVTGEAVPPEKQDGDKPPDPKAAKPNVPKIKLRFTVAADAVPGPRDFRVATPQGASTVGQLVVVRDGIVSETDDNKAPTKAQLITLPATVCGAIEAAEDVHCFKFTVDAGASLVFHVWAMRLEDRIHDLQEHVDPILTIRNAAGATVAANDNHFSADPLLFHKFDQAGEYTLEVRDVRYKGNADWVYASEVQLAVDRLPPGVTATCGRILETGSDGCILLHAAPDAPIGAANIKITGTGKHPNPIKDAPPLELSAVARPLQEYYSPGGGRGHYPVEMHTVSVAEPMDVRTVKLSTNSVTLKPGESQKIEVTVERAPGFKGNATLDVMYQHLEQPFGNSLPKGVTTDVSGSKTLLVGEETKGFITLKAAADAPAVEKQLVPVMAHVSINFVMKATYCAEPFQVTVLPPQKK